MYKAKHDFLWFKKGEIVQDIEDNWVNDFEKIKEKEEPIVKIEDIIIEDNNLIIEEPVIKETKKKSKPKQKKKSIKK